jgi:histidine ammonia-lyase
MDTFILKPGQLTLEDIKKLDLIAHQITLSSDTKAKMKAACQVVSHYVDQDILAYGVNTGFGKLASTVIAKDKLKELQKNLVLSHAAGTANLFSPNIVKLILLLKINSLAQGYSGVRHEIVDYLIQFYNADILPCIPSKGSVGASGDLAPLAHLACALIGVGEVIFNGKRIAAHLALQSLGLTPLELGPKEGLALVNGTQVSCALALDALIKTNTVFDSAIFSGALSFKAADGDLVAFDERIHLIRKLKGQIDVAAVMRLLMGVKENHAAMLQPKVQDPYSLRCQPQVMGACLEQCRHVAALLNNEINAITDNPLVFPEDNQILSGGNFHGQIISFMADTLAPVISTMGNIAERRISLLLDSGLSGLPAFLVKDSGLNSGFMLAHVTAAALASENKVLAHPASVDTIPTSANQEDHVSMATFAGRRLKDMLDNTATIIAIELLAACQGIDLLPQCHLQGALLSIHGKVRHQIAYYDHDRYLASDIELLRQMVMNREFVLFEQVGSNICAFV